MQPKDLLRKFKDVGWIASQVRDVWLDARDYVFPDEFSRLHRLVRPYTMTGNARLRGLYDAVKYVTKHNVPGDIVECGTAKGGSAALMGLTLKALGGQRTLWLCDTFEGLPSPSPEDPDAEVAEEYVSLCRGDFEEVQAMLAKLGLLENSKLIKGLFQETLPTIDIKRIAVLHLDGDWYESVKVCLDYLYDRVSPYGVIQIDDYGHWEGARKAVDEFFAQRALPLELKVLDYTGRQLIKTTV